MKITGRSSTVTNAFVNSIIPVIHPLKQDVEEALQILGMTPDNIACVYCGDPTTDWDHLRPLVVGRRPTGHISEIANLVPACGKCNQSKGGKPWRDWMICAAKRSPTTRKVADLRERMQRLEAFEAWRQPTQIDFESVVDTELWKQHWQHRDEILDLMKASQQNAEKIKQQVREWFRSTVENERAGAAAESDET